jgi:phosphatidylinositol kinase/protein kinase (PI-3  family)
MCKAMPQVIPPLTQPRLFDLISAALVRASPAKGKLVQSSSGGSSSSASAQALSSASSASGSSSGEDGSGAASGSEQDTSMVLLALRTLATFDFSLIDLLLFVRDSLLHYLEDDNAEVRCVTALTCAVLTVRPGTEPASTRGHSAGVIADVVQKLVILGITDRDATIRKTVFEVLDSRFDGFLAQPEILRSLFAALNDEAYHIRELAIAVIGRLAHRNPAYVMPALRKTLIQLLNELEFGDARTREESAILLGHLIRSSERLVKPYVEPILRTLLPKLKADKLQGPGSSSSSALTSSSSSSASSSSAVSGGPAGSASAMIVSPSSSSSSVVSTSVSAPSPQSSSLSSSSRVASCVLSALGELAVVGTEALIPYIGDLIPTIIDTLHDQASTAKRAAKREVALRTLGQLVRSTGHLVAPLEDYPQLLDIITAELSTERLSGVRAELLKVMGILGAVDPYKHKQNQIRCQRNKERRQA